MRPRHLSRLLVTQLLRVGRATPTPSRPRASGCEGPQRLNDPGPSPSPASDLVPEPPNLPASLSAPAWPAPAEEGVLAAAAAALSSQAPGVPCRRPEEAVGCGLGKTAPAFSLPKAAEGERQAGRSVGSRPGERVLSPLAEPGQRGALLERRGWAAAASPRCYPPRPAQAKCGGCSLPLSALTF